MITRDSCEEKRTAERASEGTVLMDMVGSGQDKQVSAIAHKTNFNTETERQGRDADTSGPNPPVSVIGLVQSSILPLLGKKTNFFT